MGEEEQEGGMMPCPYCGSRRISEEYTLRTYDLPQEWVAINHVLCAKCGECYSKTIRENIATGKRKVTVSKKSYLTEDLLVRSLGIKRRVLGFFRRRRR